MPSENVLRGLKMWKREKLARIVTEFEFLYAISTEVPKRLTDEQWAEIIDTSKPDEREFFLRSIYYSESMVNQSRKCNLDLHEASKEEYAHKLTRFNDGHMVYGHDRFYSLIGEGFFGPELREKIDSIYGIHFCHSEILEDPLPKLIVDCRFFVQSWHQEHIFCNKANSGHA